MSRPDRGPRPDRGTNPPKYMNDFSKALAAEVRILLQEVGKLRDEKRALQYEVAELLAAKARYGSDAGDYQSDWRAAHEPPPSLAPPPPEPAAPPSDALVLHQDARSGWHKVAKKHERKPREPRAPKPRQPEPPPPPPPAPVANLPSWASWKPNPIYHPTPRAAAPPTPAGLFGPPSPPP